MMGWSNAGNSMLGMGGFGGFVMVFFLGIDHYRHHHSGALFDRWTAQHFVPEE